MTSPADPHLTVHVALEADVYDYLKRRSTFEDTVSSVLRRELALGETHSAAADDSPGESVDLADRGPSSPLLQRSSRTGASHDRRTGRTKTKRARAAAGTLLPEGAYHRPILEILAENGGSAPKQQVIDAVGNRLDGQLTQEDRSSLESGGIRWQSRAQFARLRLVERGLMDRHSPRGVWAITPEGAKGLEEGTV